MKWWRRWRYARRSRLRQVVLLEVGTTIKAGGLASTSLRPRLVLIPEEFLDGA